ncbi:hypothetical protein Pmi06nite_76420 [Planotetraspora mira]|uniref:Uncharacterized protein n=1 Tax=Planotetraspora mira TaxID=58121 RepID=A0A8J3U7W4_9ACTN|nr:hypothetical protein Pmi06nite_76420 [Planotetraspora mira]
MLQVAVEVNGHVTIKPYPKSRAGRREVPLPGFVVDLLSAHKGTYPAGPLGEVFTTSRGGALSRHTFRARVWRPSLVRAGLLGAVMQMSPDAFLGVWPDKQGIQQRKAF